MTKHPKYPALYEINTRVWITELSGKLKRPATLDDIPNDALDQLAEAGFDWVWFLSVWQTGELGRKVSCENQDWRRDFEETLTDLSEEDIAGSGFAITGYTVHSDLGGDAALSRLRSRLKQRGLKLMLDFVPNHMAPDHPWVEEHPDYFVHGTQSDLERFPQNFTVVKRRKDNLIMAYGRDPHFCGWPDTLQLDYSNSATQEAMRSELIRIAGQCDGLRCDMAMLILPEVFEKTWGRKTEPFWPKAIGLFVTAFRIFALWLKFIGIWNGTFSNKVSIIPMIKDFMIVYMKARPNRCGNTFMQNLIIKLSWSAFLKITMNSGQHQHSK